MLSSDGARRIRMNQEHRPDTHSEPPLSPLEKQAFEWLLAGKRNTQPLDESMMELARLALALKTPDPERTMAMLATHRVALARSRTDERLRWSLPMFLVTLTLLMLAMVSLDAAGRIELKWSTLMALNASLFGTVTTLLSVVVKFFFGKHKQHAPV
jgi:hypothetical protein